MRQEACTHDGCTNRMAAMRLCERHYREALRAEVAAFQRAKRRAMKMMKARATA